MEITKILTADVLDIIFEGRNKEYGAYDLRRTYGKRLTVSIAVMFLLMGLLYAGMVLAGRSEKDLTAKFIEGPDVILDKIVEKEKEPEVIPPPPKQEEPPKMEMKKLVDQFKIVPDDVPADVVPPVDDLIDVKIGNINQEGLKDDGIVAPPVTESGQGIFVEPKKEVEDWERVFIKVEQESEYPGGYSAWKRYLERNLRYPQDAMDANVQGTVTVQFIVDKEGNVSDVSVLSGPEELRAEAVRVIKKSGKWAPAIQNGHKVRSYKKQPVSFVMPQE